MQTLLIAIVAALAAVIVQQFAVGEVSPGVTGGVVGAVVVVILIGSRRSKAGSD